MKDEIMKIAAECLDEHEVHDAFKTAFTKAVTECINDAFRWGEIKKKIETRIKDTMLPYIEQYDFSEYLPKLDAVLTEIVNSENCRLNKDILENFNLVATMKKRESITVTELFEEWIKHCEKNIDTSELEVIVEDRPSYSCGTASFHVVDSEKRNYSRAFEYKVIQFRCEEDEALNIDVPIYMYHWHKDKSQDQWELDLNGGIDLNSIGNMSKFELLLMMLHKDRTEIVIDMEFDDGFEICPEAEPEADWS